MACRNETSPGSSRRAALDGVHLHRPRLASRRFRLALPLAPAMFGLGGRAAAQGTATEPPSAQHIADLAGHARKLCARENPQHGAAVLAELYVVTGHPAWVYNQGRCWEENGHYEKARLRFEEYPRKVEEITESDRLAVERRIEDLKLKSRHTKATGGPGADTEAEVVARSPQPSGMDDRLPVTAAVPSQQQGGSWQKKLGVAGLTVGAVGLMVGAVFHRVSDSRINAFDAAGCGVRDLSVGADCQQRNDNVNSALTFQWAGYGGGALLGAAGMSFLLTAPDGPWTRRNDEDRAAEVAVIGQPTLGTTGLSCGGRF